MRTLLALVFGAALSVGCGGGDGTGSGGRDGSADGSGGSVDGTVGGGGDGTVGGGGDGTVGGGGDGTVGGGGDAAAPGPIGMSCGDRACECEDGVDNDGDGTIDGFDAECTGPFDDDEDSFATGQPGDNIDFCQDCFFDGNSGAGDDDCAYHTDCITEGAAPMMGGGADCFTCDVSATCLERCLPQTPNGCDCFGCCTVTLDDGSTVDIFLQATCSLENINDTTACPRCFKSDTCNNECGECELCPGRELADLPDTCFAPPPTDGGTPPDAYVPPPRCEGGETPCDSQADCAEGYFCQQGCCLPILI